MSKRTQTVVTLHVRVQVPEKSNAAEVMELVRIALNIKETGFQEVTVKLVKKETSYV